ncbi:MAG: hypothetical protein ACREHG_02920 [Candidatus Saccharimonadales bacterium]
MAGELAEVYIPICSLVPAQCGLSKVVNLQQLVCVNYDELPPIETVLFSEDGQPEPMHLVVDGHHRAYGVYWQGHQAVKGIVARSDEQLSFLSAKSIVGCRTIDEVVQRYRREWLPAIKALGVTGIDTMICPVAV